MTTLPPHAQKSKAPTRWHRLCPSCGTDIYYTSKQIMRRQEALQSLCRSCYCKHKQSTELSKLIVAAHSQGLGDREIARTIGCHHRTVCYHLKKLGLTTNKPRGKPPIAVSETTAICSSCGEEVLKSDFALLRSYDDGRRLSKCRKCRKAQEYARLTNHIKAYLRDKEVRCQVRARKLGIAYTLSYGYIVELYERQNGCCFYTDMPLTAIIGEGRLPTAVSIDKVDPRGGYTPDNIVLCASRINSIKMNVTPEEMKEWMPNWYERVVAEVASGRLIVKGILDD